VHANNLPASVLHVRSVQEFRRHALRTSETFLFAAALFAEAASYSTASEQQHQQSRLDAITMLCKQQPVRLWWDVVSNTDAQTEEAQQQVAESWCLLKPLLDSDTNVAAQCVLPLTLDSYAALLGQLELQLLPLQLENPLVNYCTSLLTASASEKASALQQLAAIVPGAMPVTSSADTQSSVIVQTERAIAKLVQAAGDPTVCPFPPFSAVTVLPSIGTVAHSCIPNVQLEAEHDSSTVKQLVAKLVALRDITADKPLTMARIPVNQPYAQRRAELRRVLRNAQYVCKCDRCIWEQHSTAASSTQQLSFSAQQYITLAQQSLEESRHSDALQLYKCALQSEPCNGDALHGVGVAHLASGDWTAAHTAWRTGVQLAPQHSALAAQACKDAAYELAHSAAAVATTNDSAVAYDAYEGQVYMTSELVLTAAECTSVIDAVEAQAAASKGWTTSR
jgi:tetratricopeptide (TPR) repeat protein